MFRSQAFLMYYLLFFYMVFVDGAFLYRRTNKLQILTNGLTHISDRLE